MYVHRVIHHRLVDDAESDAFAVSQYDRLRFAELSAVDRPEVSLHVACQAHLDDAVVRLVGIRAERPEIAIRKDFCAFRCSRIVQERVGRSMSAHQRNALHVFAPLEDVRLRSFLNALGLHDRCGPASTSHSGHSGMARRLWHLRECFRPLGKSVAHSRHFSVLHSRHARTPAARSRLRSLLRLFRRHRHSGHRLLRPAAVLHSRHLGVALARHTVHVAHPDRHCDRILGRDMTRHVPLRMRSSAVAALRAEIHAHLRHRNERS
ncbi:hypothetical protein ES703_125930 [subsurface metagenome]